jgi:hypothetical protein
VFRVTSTKLLTLVSRVPLAFSNEKVQPLMMRAWPGVPKLWPPPSSVTPSNDSVVGAASRSA